MFWYILKKKNREGLEVRKLRSVQVGEPQLWALSLKLSLMWNQQLSLSSSRACLLHSPLPSQFPYGQSPAQPKEETESSGFMRHLMTAQRGITSLECTIISKVPVKWVYLELRSFSWRRNWNLYCVLWFFFPPVFWESVHKKAKR